MFWNLRIRHPLLQLGLEGKNEREPDKELRNKSFIVVGYIWARSHEFVQIQVKVFNINFGFDGF